jgi:hypothetical protein
MVHDPWRQGDYNADSDFSASSSVSEAPDKRCYKFKSRDKVGDGTVVEACGRAME